MKLRMFGCIGAAVLMLASSGLGEVVPPPKLLLTRGPRGKVRLDYPSNAGQTNWVSVSTNLVDWTVIGSSVADTNGGFYYIDTAAARIIRRFYRVFSEFLPSPRLQFGLFVSWSNSTFTGRTKDTVHFPADWPSPYTDPSQSTEIFFNPPGLEAADVAALREQVTDAWADLAKSAGMTHLLLCVKHVEGFCLWDSSVSPDFCITAPTRREAQILHSDLVRAVSQSCAAKGLKLGFYYCLADQHNGWRPAIVKRHLNELLDGRYGSIDYLFLDIGYGGQDLEPIGMLKYYVSPVQRQDLLDFIHGEGLDTGGSGLMRLGLTDVLVGFNDPAIPLPGDFMCVENGHPEIHPQIPTQFSFPIITGPTRLSWFYTTPEQENRCMSVHDLRDYYDRSLDCRNIFDLSVGPDRTGRIRKIDVETISALAEALSDRPSERPNHFLVNNDGVRINGRPNGTISYNPAGGWVHKRSRQMGDYSEDAHVTTIAGDYCEYQFTGTAVEFLTSKSSNAGSVDIWVDELRRTPRDGLSLHSWRLLPRQVVFTVAGLPLGPHNIKVVSRVDGPEVAVDAFRVYSGVPHSISVDNEGTVWVVDTEHLIWTYRPESSDAPGSWARMPGTASDIGCGSSVWKIGTDVPVPTLFPLDYSISKWTGPNLEWRKLVFGESKRIDVASDGCVWAVNNMGDVGWFPNPTTDTTEFFYAGKWNRATDIGCQSAGGTRAGKIGPGSTIGSWKSTYWDVIAGEGARIDVAADGALWVVSEKGDLSKYHEGLWFWKSAGAVDVGCGADGEVWFVATDGTIQRVVNP